MDQFSYDLAIALEETSLLDRAHVSRWCQRRRTRSTGNLPCAPQPTEDSSSSPYDANTKAPSNVNVDIQNPGIIKLSDSDDKEETQWLAKNKHGGTTRMGTIESDSLNEAFSPARFFRPSTRKKRKFKRTSIEFDPNIQYDYLKASSYGGTSRKRLLKPEVHRSTVFFSGKRKRSNKDRYYDYEPDKLHSSSAPRQHNISPMAIYFENNSIRPRSHSFTSQPPCNRILPLNKGLVSKIEKISNLEKIKSSNISDSNPANNNIEEIISEVELDAMMQPIGSDDCCSHIEPLLYRKKYNRLKRDKFKTSLQFDQQISMECGGLYDFLSSSSLSSTDSDNEQANDTDREGDDELTDWPGNEGNYILDAKYDLKRKLTKKSHLIALKTEDVPSLVEDDTLMGITECQGEVRDSFELKFKSSEPIAINNNNVSLQNCKNFSNAEVSVPLKQIESEMSGETSNTFLSSPPCQPIREIRAGCRRIKCERAGFSIKTSVNERLARFLQDAQQSQVRLPDIEIYERESLLNLAKLYSLQMSLDKGCAILTKTSNTTQSVNVEQQSIHSRLFLSDYKRRCYDSKGNFLPRK